jgi:hypothetical protein
MPVLDSEPPLAVLGLADVPVLAALLDVLLDVLLLLLLLLLLLQPAAARTSKTSPAITGLERVPLTICLMYLSPLLVLVGAYFVESGSAPATPAWEADLPR